MKKLSMEHTENVPTGDVLRRAPELKKWNSFSQPKKECDLHAHPVEMISRLNPQIEELKI